MTSNRERLPETRQAITHKFNIGANRGYVTVGLYPDGRVGEVFIKMDKVGSTASGLLDALSIAVSVGLQSGIELAVFCNKFRAMRFEPQGPTGSEFGIASSVVDYVFRWLEKRFVDQQEVLDVQANQQNGAVNHKA